MRSLKLAFAGLTFLISTQNIAGAAEEAPFSILSGSESVSFSSGRDQKEAEISVKAKGIKKVLKAYAECSAKGNMAIVSIPAKNVSCEVPQFKPRGSYFGDCYFRGSVLCVSKEAMADGATSRLGNQVTDLITGRQTIDIPGKGVVDFSEYRDLIKD